MKNSLRFSHEALDDLDEIREYIQEDSCNPDIALNAINQILDAIDILRDYPELGATLFSTFGVESDYRSLICGSYIAFYRVDDGKVYIERVLSGRRDYLRVLFGELPENGIEAMSAPR